MPGFFRPLAPAPAPAPVVVVVVVVVVVGNTMLAVRLAEAHCVMVDIAVAVTVDIAVDIPADFTGGRAATATVTPVLPR